MQDHSQFSYFTEVEEHFQRRRGSAMLLGTLDWALIETWKDAGIPLEAVLRGIDATFDRYDARPSKTRKVNSLAYCSQEVLAAAEEMTAAAEGAVRTPESQETGFSPNEVGNFLSRCADELSNVEAPSAARTVIEESAATLRELASGFAVAKSISPEDLERRLTVMEEKIFSALMAATPDDALVGLRAEADRELAPYRRKMPASEIERLHKHYLHKRMLERCHVPRLSLFYMG